MNEAPRELLTEAADWRLLSLLFDYPAGSWREQVGALGPEAGDPKLRQAAAAALAEASEGEHQSIFGPGGPVPAREASYQTGVQLGYLLAELSSIYEGFGYNPATTESPDHAAVETGFIAFLKFKQAYALACGSDDEAGMCSEAAEFFIREHLRVFAGPVAQGLEAGAPPYLALAGRALLERVGPPAGAPAFALPGLISGDDDADAGVICGADSPASAPLIQLQHLENRHEP
jgi:nitrate reductase assembly molybdenum cofactor insertion protein NarJ